MVLIPLGVYHNQEKKLVPCVSHLQETLDTIIHPHLLGNFGGHHPLGGIENIRLPKIVSVNMMILGGHPLLYMSETDLQCLHLLICVVDILPQMHLIAVMEGLLNPPQLLLTTDMTDGPWKGIPRLIRRRLPGLEHELLQGLERSLKGHL